MVKKVKLTPKEPKPLKTTPPPKPRGPTNKDLIIASIFSSLITKGYREEDLEAIKKEAYRLADFLLEKGK